MTRRPIATLLGLALITLIPAALASPPAKETYTTTRSGLRYLDTKAGSGATPAAGQACTVHYTGWLYKNDKKGKKFDSSVDKGQPFTFSVGQGEVIGGWDEGVSTMKVGGKRTLIIPPDLGYGAKGAGRAIPANATLMFDVELLGVK